AVGAQAGQRRAAARSTRWEERQARSGHGSSHDFWRLSISTATDRERQSIRTATGGERQGFPESKKHYIEVSPLIHLRLSATEVAGSRRFFRAVCDLMYVEAVSLPWALLSNPRRNPMLMAGIIWL